MFADTMWAHLLALGAFSRYDATILRVRAYGSQVSTAPGADISQLEKPHDECLSPAAATAN